jgi:hypothetical protein
VLDEFQELQPLFTEEVQGDIIKLQMVGDFAIRLIGFPGLKIVNYSS